MLTTGEDARHGDQRRSFGVGWLILSIGNSNHKSRCVPMTTMQCDKEGRPSYD